MTMKQVREEFRRMRSRNPLTTGAGLRAWIRFAFVCGTGFQGKAAQIAGLR